VPAVTGQERILVGGWSRKSQASPSEWTMLRLKPSGVKDTSFGTSGRVTTGFLGFSNQLRRIAVDSANRIVAAGTVRAGVEACGVYTIDYGIARYTQDGLLDANFSGGTQLVDVYGGLDDLRGLVIQADGKILIAGSAYSSDNIIKDFAIVRFDIDGTRDFSFGPLGNAILTTDFYGFGDHLQGIAVQPSDGKIMLTGSMYVNSNRGGVIGLARYWP
jgi:uncharacterized delta-60 repeat protein